MELLIIRRSKRNKLERSKNKSSKLQLNFILQLDTCKDSRISVYPMKKFINGLINRKSFFSSQTFNKKGLLQTFSVRKITTL